MKNRFYILILSVLITSCTSNTILKKPKDLIPKDEMVSIITDMLIANSAFRIKNINLNRNINYFPLIMEKYNVDSTRFKSSNYYYTSKIDEYDVIIKEVKARLTYQKKIVDSIRKISDSIVRVKKLKTSKKKLKDINSKQQRELDSMNGVIPPKIIKDIVD